MVPGAHPHPKSPKVPSGGEPSPQASPLDGSRKSKVQCSVLSWFIPAPKKGTELMIDGCKKKVLQCPAKLQRELSKRNGHVLKSRAVVKFSRVHFTETRGVTALTKAVSGEKQIYSGNLEILPGIGKPGKFFGKYEIFSGH